VLLPVGASQSCFNLTYEFVLSVLVFDFINDGVFDIFMVNVLLLK
jgi:hypothetical protein